MVSDQGTLGACRADRDAENPSIWIWIGVWVGVIGRRHCYRRSGIANLLVLYEGIFYWNGLSSKAWTGAELISPTISWEGTILIRNKVNSQLD